MFKLLCLVLALCAPLGAAAEPLQKFLDRFVREERLPGAVLLVSGPNGRQVVAAGVANTKTNEAVTPATRFYIASSGKLATAVAALQLVDEGKLKLNERVFPAMQSVAGLRKLRNVERVTLEQLLGHRSGLAEYFDDDFEEMWAAQPDKVWTAQELLEIVHGEPAQGAPGSAHNYTNTNYVLLGQLIESIDQTPFARSIQRRVFDKVGMRGSSVGADKAASGLAHGYSRDDRGRQKDVSYMGWNAITGDGAVVTTAADYEAFLFALFRDGKLLSDKTLQRMCTVPSNDADSDYGLGCQTDDSDWGTIWGHSGSISGFNAEAWYVPGLRTALVFLTNGDLKNDDPKLVSRALKAYLAP